LREINRDTLRKWGQALKDEGNSLGDSLLAYADAWDAEVADLNEDLLYAGMWEPE
jgi:hypothetical protein